jgi:hypothetical protein
MAVDHTSFFTGADYDALGGPDATPNLSIFRFKRGESYPVATGASSNDSPGTSGALTAQGQINSYIDWHSELRSITGGSAIADTSTTYGISLVSVATGFRSVASAFTANITIRNAQNFTPSPGQTVTWSASGGGSGTVSANADGTVTIPSLTIPTTATRLSLSIATPGSGGRIRLRIRGLLPN